MTVTKAAATAVDNVDAVAILRGVSRLLLAHAIAPLAELPLPDGRRADVVGLGPDGTISIVEIKSSLADFRADRKWQAYRAYCDVFYFAVSPGFPASILPAGTGLILADAYGGDFARSPEAHPLGAVRRRVVTLRFARAAASRFAASCDPEARLADF